MYKTIKLGVSDKKYKFIHIKKEDNLYFTHDYNEPVKVAYGAYLDNGEVFSFHSYMKATNLSYDDSAKELSGCFAELIGEELQVGFYEKDDLDKFIENLDDWGVLY